MVRLLHALDSGDDVTQPVSPFNTLLAQLTQGMSAARGQRVPNELGWQKGAQHTTEERVVWKPAPLDVQSAPFQLPDLTTPWRQASNFLVEIMATSYDRVLEIHALLVAWLDLIVGPPMGSVPSDDAVPARIRGTEDLNLLAFPYSGLIGKTLDFVAPLKRTFEFPAGDLANVDAIAAAINAQSYVSRTNAPAQAAALPTIARIAREGDAAYLELMLPTDPLGTVGATLSVNTATADSACPILGIEGNDSDIATNTGTAPTRPYRPGYFVGESQEPGVRGGDLSSQGWGVIVPVTLYRPIVSMQFLRGVVLETPTEVVATGGDTPDETVVDIA